TRAAWPRSVVPAAGAVAEGRSPLSGDDPRPHRPAMGLDAAADLDRPAEPDPARLAGVLSSRSSETCLSSTQWLPADVPAAAPSPPQSASLPRPGRRHPRHPLAAPRPAIPASVALPCACPTLMVLG